MLKHLSLTLFVLFAVSVVAAQADCPALVDAAFAVTNEACADLGRNQVCYGNILLDATPREGATAFNFEQTGDVANVADIDTLQLSSMSLTDETWGVALMLLQANLADTLPGQNVTVLMFGDVNVANAVDELTELPVSATANVNIRLRPTTSENNVIASLSRGENVIANGRLEDGSWIRILLGTDSREVGWVSADFLTSDQDFDTLMVVEGGAPLFAPMQAFYFASSIGDSQCAEAPDSGILIQTPQGAGEVTLRVNEVDVRLGSTVFMTAGGGFMTVNVVEGHAVLSADGVSQTVPAGTYAEIPLDSNGLADGAPTFPQPYNFSAMQSLPVSVALPQSVSVTLPIRDEAEIAVAIDIADGLPPRGSWSDTLVITANTCNPEDQPIGTSWSIQLPLVFNEDRSAFYYGDPNFRPHILFSRVSDDTYVAYVSSEGNTGTWTLTFTSPTTYFISFVEAADAFCQYRFENTGVFIG